MVHLYEGRTATFQYENESGDKVKDFKGNIIIHSILGEEVEVDAEDIIEFIAEQYVRPKLIKCIEQTPSKDLLLNQLNADC